MFGAFDVSRAMKQYRDRSHLKLPLQRVSKKEFVRRMVAAGKTQEEAELQATICKGLGAETVVKGERLTIK
jgi:hypothetical protein